MLTIIDKSKDNGLDDQVIGLNRAHSLFYSCSSISSDWILRSRNSIFPKKRFGEDVDFLKSGFSVKKDFIDLKFPGVILGKILEVVITLFDHGAIILKN